MKHHMPCAAYMQALSKGIAISVPLLRQPFSRTIDPTTISVISDTVWNGFSHSNISMKPAL